MSTTAQFARILASIEAGNIPPARVDAGGGPDNPNLLHFDMERGPPVVEAMFSAMHAEAIAQNPLDPEAESLPLCGGCTVMALSLLVSKILDRANASISQRRAYRRLLVEELQGDQDADEIRSWGR